jgi:lysophospholipase L1-like esterase
MNTYIDGEGSMKYFVAFIFIVLGISLINQSALHATSGAYAALGDSVAAGAGLPSSDTTCKRSTESYTYSVASTVGLPLEHYACSGAKVDEGIYGSQKVGTKLPTQLDQAFAKGKPSLISLTIGANDARWTQFIYQCYYIKCGYKADTLRFKGYLLDLKLELNTAMAKISTLSNGKPPQVILTGYYNPLTKAACSDTEGLTSSEISWLKTRTSSLNSTISSVASKYSYVTYASTSFRGHELCSSEPWVQGLDDPMPFHPTAAGQQAIARSVSAKYKSSDQSTSPKSTRERILDWYNRQKQQY